MKNISISLVGFYNFRPTVKIDNKVIKIKKSSHGNYECNCQTENDKIQVSVYKFQEINSRLWWLMGIVYFIISLGGLFDIPFGKTIMSLNSEFAIDVNNDDSIKLYLTKSSIQEKSTTNAIKVETKSNYEIINNVCFVDTKAKKRIKIYRWTKVAVWIATLIFVIVMLITGVF